MGDSVVGMQARLMSQAMRKLNPAIAKTNTCIIFINQLREKIGIMFGNPETTTGGKALKFYASIRMDVRRIDAVKDASGVVGNPTRVKVVKNKLAPPFKQAVFAILFGTGISRYGVILDMAVAAGLILKSGAWFSYEGEKIGQGREKAVDFLKQNAELADALEARIRETF